MSKHEIISKEIKTSKKYDYLKLASGEFSVSLDVDSKLDLLIKNNRHLKGELTEIATDAYNDLIRELDKLLENADADIEKLQNSRQQSISEKEFYKRIDDLNEAQEALIKTSSENCRKNMLKRWDKLKIAYVGHAKSTLGVYMKTKMSSASLTVSIASLLLAPPTMGLTLALSIYGIVKSTSNLIQQGLRDNETAQDTLARIEDSINELKKILAESREKRDAIKAYLSSQGAVISASIKNDGPEATAKIMFSSALIREFFSSEQQLIKTLESGKLGKGGLSGADFTRELMRNFGVWATSYPFTCLKSLSDDWGLLKEKANSLEVTAHSLEVALGEVQEQMDKLDKVFDSKDAARFKGAYQKFTKAIRVAIDALESKSNDEYKRFKYIDAKIKECSDKVATILELRNDWFDSLDYAFLALDVVLVFVGGGGNALKAADKFMEDVAPGLLQTVAEFGGNKFIDALTKE